MKLKERTSIIIVTAVFILIIACLMRTFALEKQIYNLEHVIHERFSQTGYSIGNISYDIREALEEQANLLSKSYWEYGKLDIQGGKVIVHFEITPKEYSPDTTDASLLLNGKEHRLTLKNGIYSADIALPLFEDSLAESVLINDEGVVRTQKLDWYFTPRNECLPMIDAVFEGGGSISTKDGVCLDSRKGLVVINVTHKGDKNSIKTADFVIHIDGKETERRPIDLSYSGQEVYLDRGSTGNIRRAMPEIAAYEEGSYSQLYYYVDGTREIPFGSTADYYVEITDSDLRYSVLCDSRVVTTDGLFETSNKGMNLIGYEVTIIDKNGKVLYAPDESLFQ